MKKLIKILLICTLMLLALCVTASAETEGYYTYVSINGEATITDVDTSISGDVIIPSTLGGCKVVGIDYRAFYWCRSLTSIVIPDGVITIDNDAFEMCTSLTRVELPDSITHIGNFVFSECESLESIELPNSITYLGEFIFSGCESLANIEIPNSVTVIGNRAFSYCKNLTNINIPYSVTTIGEKAFYGCESLIRVKIPDKVTAIYVETFLGCKKLVSVEIGRSVTTIGEKAFYGCESLTSINVSKDNEEYCSEDGVLFNKGKTTLVQYPAGKIKNSYILPDGVTTIGYRAFSGCYNLTSIEIPNSIIEISEGAFFDCSSLEELTIPFVGSQRGNSGTADSVFGYIFGTTSYTGSYMAKQYYTSSNSISYYIPSSLKKVVVTNTEVMPYGAFSGCSSLEELTIPFVGSQRGNSGTADSLFGYIFGTASYADSYMAKQYYASISNISYCIPTKLSKVTVADENVIPYGAFQNCTNISDIIIQGNPTAIMANSFADIYNLFNVTVKSEKVKYVSSNIFKNSDFSTMYGYAGSTTETYAKKYNVEFIPLDYYEEYTLSGNAKSLNEKIVVNVKVSDKVKDKHLHIALYDADGKQIDYIIVPTYDVFDEINVVFADNKSAKSAKLFLWESLVSLTPISSSVEIEISR